MERKLGLALIAVFAFGVSSTLQAQQTTGDILGTVTDSSAAAVAGATVTAENTGTQEKRTTETSTTGDYVINLLNPATYRLTIAARGFKVFTVPSLRLAAGDRTRVDAELAIGPVSETVTVEAHASALQTDASVLSDTVNDKAVEELPLNGRNFVQLVPQLF